MHPGLFTLICPTCAGEITPSSSGHGSCGACGRAYLIRRGQLLEISAPVISNVAEVDLRPDPAKFPLIGRSKPSTHGATS